MAPKTWHSAHGERRERGEKRSREADGRRRDHDDREGPPEAKRPRDERNVKHHLGLGGGKILACLNRAEAKHVKSRWLEADDAVCDVDHMVDVIIEAARIVGEREGRNMRTYLVNESMNITMEELQRKLDRFARDESELQKIPLNDFIDCEKWNCLKKYKEHLEFLRNGDEADTKATVNALKQQLENEKAENIANMERMRADAEAARKAAEVASAASASMLVKQSKIEEKLKREATRRARMEMENDAARGDDEEADRCVRARQELESELSALGSMSEQEMDELKQRHKDKREAAEKKALRLENEKRILDKIMDDKAKEEKRLKDKILADKAKDDEQAAWQAAGDKRRKLEEAEKLQKEEAVKASMRQMKRVMANGDPRLKVTFDPLPPLRNEDSDNDEPTKRRRSVKSRSESTSPQKSIGSDPDEPYEEVPVIETKHKPRDDKVRVWIARCSKGGGLHDKRGTAREIGSFCHTCSAPWAMKDEVVS